MPHQQHGAGHSSVKKEATGVVRLGTRYSSLFANMVQYVQAADNDSISVRTDITRTRYAYRTESRGGSILIIEASRESS